MLSQKNENSEKDMIGKQIGQYLIKSYIGKGGIGDVWLVQHHVSGKIRAMKILKEEHRHDKEIVNRFLTGFKEQARYEDNEHIIKCLDGGHDEKQDIYYLVMEYIYGTDLDHLIHTERKKFTWNEILLIMEGVTSALSDLHKNGTIHRDLKPANILIQNIQTKSLVPKNKMVKAKVTLEKSHCRIVLTDFDIVKTKINPKLTVVGATLGTPQFMAPEQRNSSRDAGVRSDIYSLGQILYELVTGKRAQTEPNIVSQAAQILKEGKCPAHVIDVIKKATENDEAKRYKSVGAMFDALEKGKKGAQTTIAGGRIANLFRQVIFLPKKAVRATAAATQVETMPPGGRSRPVTSLPHIDNASHSKWPNIWVFMAIIAFIGFVIYYILTSSPPPPPANHKHHIYVDTDPAVPGFDKNAVLLIVDSDTVANRLPVTVEIAAGKYPAALWSQRQSGNIMRWQGTWAVAGDDSFFIPIEPDTFHLSINTIPKGATIWLNGSVSMGKSPIQNYRVVAGQHNLQIELPKYGTIDTTLTVAKDCEFLFRMSPATASIAFKVRGIAVQHMTLGGTDGVRDVDGAFVFNNHPLGNCKYTVITPRGDYSDYIKIEQMSSGQSIVLNLKEIQARVLPYARKILVYKGNVENSAIFNIAEGKWSCVLAESEQPYSFEIENPDGGLIIRNYIVQEGCPPIEIDYGKRLSMNIRAFRNNVQITGGKIYINGELQKDKTPLINCLKYFGVYDIEVRYEGFEPKVEHMRFELSPGKTNCHYEFKF